MLQAALYCVCPRHPHPIILLSYLHTYPHSLDLPKTSHVQLSSFTARRGGLVSSGPLRSSSAALSRARRAWRSSGRACEDATAHPSPGRATSRASYLDSTAQHSTPHCSALLCNCNCNTPSTQQTQHFIAPPQPSITASRCATCCAVASHCIRCTQTSVAAPSPSPHRCPPSLARCRRPASRARPRNTYFTARAID